MFFLDGTYRDLPVLSRLQLLSVAGASAPSAAGALFTDLCTKSALNLALEVKDKMRGRVCSVLLFLGMH